MVMLPALAPTFFIAATPLAGDRQLPIPVVIEPCVRAPEGVLRRADVPARHVVADVDESGGDRRG